jgi:hypothetical protein
LVLLLLFLLLLWACRQPHEYQHEFDRKRSTCAGAGLKLSQVAGLKVGHPVLCRIAA